MEVIAQDSGCNSICSNACSVLKEAGWHSSRPPEHLEDSSGQTNTACFHVLILPELSVISLNRSICHMGLLP